MSAKFVKTEGGHKRGHSNVVHWDVAEEIKRRAKKARRLQSKQLCKPPTE